MHDAQVVHVVDGLHDLLDELARVPLRVAAFGHDAVEQLATCYSF